MKVYLILVVPLNVESISRRSFHAFKFKNFYKKLNYEVAIQCHIDRPRSWCCKVSV